MATEAARLKGKNSLVRKREIDWTLAGLLMEGLGCTYLRNRTVAFQTDD